MSFIGGLLIGAVLSSSNSGGNYNVVARNLTSSEMQCIFLALLFTFIICYAIFCYSVYEDFNERMVNRVNEATEFHWNMIAIYAMNKMTKEEIAISRLKAKIYQFEEKSFVFSPHWIAKLLLKEKIAKFVETTKKEIETLKP